MLIDLLTFIDSRLYFPVDKNKPISAVEGRKIFFACNTVFSNHALIYPIPDITAYQTWVFFHCIPVFLMITQCITLRVSIFAHQYRTCFTFLSSKLYNSFYRRIHGTDNIYSRRFGRIHCRTVGLHKIDAITILS